MDTPAAEPNAEVDAGHIRQAVLTDRKSASEVGRTYNTTDITTASTMITNNQNNYYMRGSRGRRVG